MSSKRLLVTSTLLSAAALVHCSSASDAPVPPPEDGGSIDDSAVPDAFVEAAPDASISDAGIEDDYEIPDGAVTCGVKPCAVGLTGVGTSAGSSFCVLLEDGSVHCWGGNQGGHLGFSPAERSFSTVPRRIEGLTAITSVTLGGGNGCAVGAGGEVWCWGAALLVNGARDLDGSAPYAGRPALVDLVPPSASIAIGPSANARFPGTACVTTADAGAVYCWGNNDSSQLGPRPIATSAPPGEVPLGNRTAIAVATPGRRTFAITPTGELLSWGRATCGSPTCKFLLGRDISEDTAPAPMTVPALANVRAVASGPNHSCAIAGRLVECWGSNAQAGLGLGTTTALSWLPQPTLLASVVAADDAGAGGPPHADVPLHLGADELTTCAVMGSGRIYCWGMNGPEDTRGLPRRVDGLTGPAVAVAVGRLTSCALLRTGAVECWGSNQLGALGRGLDDESLVAPTPGAVIFPDENRDE